MKTGIKTKWASEAVCEMPLSEYPRPQMERDNWYCLNGKFDYAVTQESTQWVEKYDGEILVPLSIESVLSGVNKKISEDFFAFADLYFTA